jgi:TonB family protein
MKWLKTFVVMLCILICFISCASYSVKAEFSDEKTNYDIGPFEKEDLDTPPRVIRTVPPQYPFPALINNIEGRLVLKFIVTTDGTAREIEVFGASPDGVGNIFGKAAIKSVKNYQFEPGMKNGKPVETIVKLAVAFQMDGAFAFSNDFINVFEDGCDRLDNNEFKKAIKRFSSAIGLYRHYSPTFYLRGLAYSKTDNNKKAIKDFDKAIKLDPEEPDYYQARGAAYLTLEKFDKAIQDFTEVLILEEGDIRAYTSRGYCHKKLNDTDNMCLDYKKACELGECRGYELLKNSGLCNDSNEK